MFPVWAVKIRQTHLQHYDVVAVLVRDRKSSCNQELRMLLRGNTIGHHFHT